MLRKRIKLGLLGVCIFLFLISTLSVGAVVIGANKGIINFKNVLKNGYAQELVTLTTDTDFNLSITYKVEGEVADWIRLDPPTQPFFISRDHPYTVAVVVEPPSDAKNQLYTASIQFLTGALAGPEGQFGTAVRAAINTRMDVGITGQEIVSCSAAGFELDDVEENYPLEFYAVVTNNGNVRLKPEFTLEFWNQDQSKIINTSTFTVNENIFPTVQKKIFYSLKHNLPIGQYWVRIKTSPCGDAGNGFITTSVLERGGVSDKGELLAIENEPWVKVGSIVPIDAVFRNFGSRVVSAKFKGTISSGEEIFKIIDTDPLDVVPGDTVKIRTYFNPVQEGQYMITGRVLYNKKLTFEKSSVLNVNPAGQAPLAQKAFGWSTIFVLVVVIIIILVVLIVRKRRKLRKGHIHSPR